MHHIYLTFQKPNLLIGAFHTGVGGGNLLLIKSTVAFHEVQLLNAFQSCKHLAHKGIRFRCEVVILLFETSAHDICHSHIVVNGLDGQPEPFQNRLTEYTNNLFLVYFLCMADALSSRLAARRASPNGIASVSICHRVEPSTLPTDEPLRKCSRLLLEPCPVIQFTVCLYDFLRFLKQILINDCRMVVPDKILWNFTVVFLNRMGQIIRCEHLLNENCSHVSLGTDDSRDIPSSPAVL